IGVLLDEYHVAPGPDADRVRDAIAHLIRESLGPDDRIAVVRPLDSILNITLSADREAALRAVNDFDPRRDDYSPRSAFERELIAGAPPRMEATRSQIVGATLNALALELGRSGEGRKTLFFVSEGAVAAPLRRGGELLPGFASAAQTANKGHVA